MHRKARASGTHRGQEGVPVQVLRDVARHLGVGLQFSLIDPDRDDAAVGDVQGEVRVPGCTEVEDGAAGGQAVRIQRPQALAELRVYVLQQAGVPVEDAVVLAVQAAQLVGLAAPCTVTLTLSRGPCDGGAYSAVRSYMPRRAVV